MPKNCSKDVAAAIKTVDQILLHGSDEDKGKLKKSFGLGNLEDDDFGEYVLERNVRSLTPRLPTDLTCHVER